VAVSFNGGGNRNTCRKPTTDLSYVTGKSTLLSYLTQKVFLENVEAELTKRGKQLSVPLETKMAIM
jgi:hypothetical protein